MRVWANLRHEVDVDPVHVLDEINIINPGDWIIEKDGKYIQMTEQSAGQHSFEDEVGEVSEEIYNAYKAKHTLINFLKKNKS